MVGTQQTAKSFDAVKRLFYRIRAERPDYIEPLLKQAKINVDTLQEQWFYSQVMDGKLPSHVIHEGSDAGRLTLEEKTESGWSQLKGVAPVDFMSSDELEYYNRGKPQNHLKI